MSSHNAFPIVNHGESVRAGCEGLTKREYAAIQIAAGIYASMAEGYSCSDQVAAASAVRCADALLAELDKP